MYNNSFTALRYINYIRKKTSRFILEIFAQIIKTIFFIKQRIKNFVKKRSEDPLFEQHTDIYINSLVKLRLLPKFENAIRTLIYKR